MPNNASESPRRSPTLSRRDTSTQLVARDTPAPNMNAADEAPAVTVVERPFPARRASFYLKGRRCVASGVPSGACLLLGANELVPTRDPGSPETRLLCAISQGGDTGSNPVGTASTERVRTAPGKRNRGCTRRPSCTSIEAISSLRTVFTVGTSPCSNASVSWPRSAAMSSRLGPSGRLWSRSSISARRIWICRSLLESCSSRGPHWAEDIDPSSKAARYLSIADSVFLSSTSARRRSSSISLLVAPTRWTASANARSPHHRRF
jgi:hypothetical protein